MIKIILSVLFTLVFLPFEYNFEYEENKKRTAMRYNGSSVYKSSIYYDNLINLHLTGDHATDVLLTALSQVGYHEGNSANDLTGYNGNGSKNFVEYTYVTGKLNGYANNGYAYAWCSSFVSWCLTNADVPKSAYGGNAPGCHTLLSNLKSVGAKISYPYNYIPKTGDVIFFKNSTGSNLYAHVGLVLYADENFVYTIEGNASSVGFNGAGGVVEKSYPLTSNKISLYATPKYHEYPQSKIDFSEELSGRHFITASSLNVRQSPSSSAKSIGVLSRGDYVYTTDSNTDWLTIEYSNKTAYISSTYAVYLHEISNDLFPTPEEDEKDDMVDFDDTVPPENLPSTDLSENDTSVNVNQTGGCNGAIFTPSSIVFLTAIIGILTTRKMRKITHKKRQG